MLIAISGRQIISDFFVVLPVFTYANRLDLIAKTWCFWPVQKVSKTTIFDHLNQVFGKNSGITTKFCLFSGTPTTSNWSRKHSVSTAAQFRKGYFSNLHRTPNIGVTHQTCFLPNAFFHNFERKSRCNRNDVKKNFF